MQLTGVEGAVRCIPNAVESSQRAGTYDLCIDRVLIDGQEVQSDFFEIRPQQMFVVISRERVRIPAGLIGYAMPKTSLCNAGILVLNTGIVDPGYDGLISTNAINFNQAPIYLRKGERFLRLVFHPLSSPGAKEERTTISDADYLLERRIISRQLPNTFLDIPAHIEIVADKLVKRQVGVFIWIFAFFSLAVAVLTLLVPYVADHIRGVPSVDKIETQNEALRNEVAELRSRIRELENR
jgi:deoxycytidine triphosphate deaminase